MPARSRALSGVLRDRGIAVPRGLGERLAAAGLSGESAAADVMAVKSALAAAAALVALPGALGGGSGRLLLLAVAPALAFLVPDALVARRVRARARLLSAQAPELLDRVRLTAEAGLSPRRALALAAAHGDGLLVREVRAALAASELALSTDQAMDRLCRRCPVPEVRALTAALRRSAVHGVPLGPAAAALATGSRADRARRIHDGAQRAAPQIQLVVALLLVPAALLLIAAGMLSGLR